MEKGFKGYHPVVNIIFFASVVVFGMVFLHPVTLFVCFTASLIYYLRLGKRAAVKTFVRFLLPLLVFATAVNALLAHYGITPLVTLPDGNKMTFEACIYGFVLGTATVSVIMWVSCCSEVITTDKFMCVFGKLLPTVALVMSMALRFLPMYKARLGTISEAQSMLGRDSENDKPLTRIRHGGKIISVLVSWVLENAVDTSDAMRARGYGLKSRTSYGKYRFSNRDLITLIVILLSDTVLVAACIKKALYCVYNPCVTINPSADFGKSYLVRELNLTLNPFTPLGVIAILLFSLLCFLPLIIDILHRRRRTKNGAN